MKNTKQYIWIFMFLFGVLLFTYSMYYFFWTGKNDIDDMKVIMSGDEKVLEDDNFEEMLEADEVDNISDNEIIEDLFVSNNENNPWNTWEEVFDEPIMGMEDDLMGELGEEDQEMIIDPIENGDWNNIIPTENNNGEWVIDENLMIVDEQAMENIPREVTIWDYNGVMIEDDRLTEIYSIYEILWFAANYPVYSFDTDISVSWLQDKIYYEEYARITDLINKLDGTIVQLNLFWEKQFFINIPTYYKKKVVMCIEKMGVTYLLIVDYDIYQDKKEFIGNLFSK